MFAPDEITQTTEELERLPRVLERRSATTGKRQRITEEKQTDALPPLTLESPNAKLAWRQVTQLRKENRHLRAVLDGQRAETQKVLNEYVQLRSEFDREITVIHESHQQDLASYQIQLQELLNERNQFNETQQSLEEHYQTLQQSFQDRVHEEARKLTQEAAEIALRSPDNAPPLIQEVVKTVELHLRQEEDKRLIEALCLKREVQRMADFLEQERLQLQQEQQQLLSSQLKVREQAIIRQKLLEERLYTRWKLISVVTSFSLLALFIVLEFVCLALFHTHVVGSVALSIIVPIVVCILLRIVLATPLSLLKTMYLSAPHKRPVKA
jgi:hypothetical protein